MEGNIVVDGVLASCYAFCDHNLAHFVMTPMQLFPKMIGWIIGGNNEISNYATIAESVGKYLLPNNFNMEEWISTASTSHRETQFLHAFCNLIYRIWRILILKWKWLQNL